MNAEPLSHAPVRVVPPVAFLTTFCAGIALSWAWRLPALEGVARWSLGGVLFVLGFMIGIGAVTTFGRARTSPNPFVATTALVEGGPYRYSRNPMYVGMILMYAGGAVLVRATAALLALPLPVLAVHFGTILPEERYLAATFGAVYADYCARVRRWI